MGWEYIDRPEDHYDLSSPVKAQRVVERLIQKMHELAGSVIPNGMPSRAAAEWYITTTNPIFKQGTKDLLIPVEKMTIPPSPGTKPLLDVSIKGLDHQVEIMVNGNGQETTLCLCPENAISFATGIIRMANRIRNRNGLTSD